MDTSTRGELHIQLDRKPTMLQKVRAGLRELWRWVRVRSKTVLQRLAGRREIVVGVEWESDEVALEQEIAIVDPTAQPGEKAPPKERILEILVTPARSSRPATVVVRTENYRLVNFVKEFKSITYQKVWRIA